MRHPHADILHAYAEGAEIEMFDGENWNRVYTPTFKPELRYRIKPKETPWYENIPPHGVLCWASDNNENPDSRNNGVLITRYYAGWYENREIKWRYATPLTDDEIRQFLRGEK